jgi:muconolactone delta-isomerase
MSIKKLERFLQQDNTVNQAEKELLHFSTIVPINMQQNQYMVDFTLPKEMSEEFVSLIPRQRSMVNRLLGAGKLLQYALSLENSKLWAIFSVEDEKELDELLQGMPLTPYMKWKVSELTFYNAAHPFVPVFSVN